MKSKAYRSLEAQFDALGKLLLDTQRRLREAEVNQKDTAKECRDLEDDLVQKNWLLDFLIKEIRRLQ